MTASSQLLAAATDTGSGEAVTFWLLAPVALLGALGVVFSKKAVHSALALATTMLSLAVLYLAQDAPFLGVVQVVVYTGAVMMLFLFVLMLVGVDSSDSLVETLRGQRIAAAARRHRLRRAARPEPRRRDRHQRGPRAEANADGNVQALANLHVQRYVFAFEVTSALLITAAVGAMVLAHRERHEPRRPSATCPRQRFRGGEHPAPLPGPGVYARHNAVDTPALLPDGSRRGLGVQGAHRAR